MEMPQDKLPENNELCWLYSITKNQTIDYLRKKRKFLDLNEIYDIQDTDNKIKEIVDIDYYNRIIDCLDEKEKEVVSLKILSNFTFKEIGEILNIPTATAQWRYYKSVHTLKILISNLALFIITFSLFIKNFRNNKLIKDNKTNNYDINKSNEDKAINNSNIKNNSDTQSIENEEQIDSIISQLDGKNAFESESISSSFTKVQYNSKIGLLSLASIFLVFSLIFGIIFVKSKKKRNKKKSK